jgi:hypothetical protein
MVLQNKPINKVNIGHRQQELDSSYYLRYYLDNKQRLAESRQD